MSYLILTQLLINHKLAVFYQKSGVIYNLCCLPWNLSRYNWPLFMKGSSIILTWLRCKWYFECSFGTGLCVYHIWPREVRFPYNPIHLLCMQQFYTCQQSHACGLKTLISRIKDNLLCLTHKSGRIVLSIIINNENSTQFPRKYSKQALKDDFVSMKLDVDVLEEAFAL